jgi:hypothetical protein
VKPAEARPEVMMRETLEVLKTYKVWIGKNGGTRQIKNKNNQKQKP